jgi:hypothetical protein
MNSALKWTPRVLALCHGLFLGVFALDAFEGDFSIGEKILGFLIHLAPTFSIFAALAVAWKWKFLGGVVFFALAGLSFLITGSENTLPVYAMVAGPPVLCGVLFIASAERPFA